MPKFRVICLVLSLLLPLVAYAQDTSEELLEAVRKSDVEKVNVLLTKGANVNAKSPYGVTPLGFACSRGNVAIVKLLLDHGAEINVQDTFYKTTPYGMTGMGKKATPELLQLLIERGAKETDQAMNYAINGNHLALAQTALTKGNFKQEALDKYLRVASKKGQKEIVAALTAAGAKETVEFKVEADVLKMYEGVFKGNMTVVFKVKDGKLIGTANGSDSILIPLKQHTFEDADDGMVLTFKVEGEKVTGVALKFPNGQMDLKKEEAK